MTEGAFQLANSESFFRPAFSSRRLRPVTVLPPLFSQALCSKVGPSVGLGASGSPTDGSGGSAAAALVRRAVPSIHRYGKHSKKGALKEVDGSPRTPPVAPAIAAVGGTPHGRSDNNGGDFNCGSSGLSLANATCTEPTGSRVQCSRTFLKARTQLSRAIKLRTPPEVCSLVYSILFEPAVSRKRVPTLVGVAVEAFRARIHIHWSRFDLERDLLLSSISEERIISKSVLFPNKETDRSVPQTESDRWSQKYFPSVDRGNIR